MWIHPSEYDTVEKRKVLKLYFAVVLNPEDRESIEAWITDAETWDKHGYCNDGLRCPKDMVNWGNLSESLLEWGGLNDGENLRLSKQDLIDNGFIENADFQKFIEKSAVWR